MKSKQAKLNLKNTLTLFMAFFISLTTYAQQNNERTITIEELFVLTRENHPSLKVSQSDIVIARQGVEVAKTAQLPNLDAGLQASYIGNAHIIDKDFSNSTKVPMPHFGNTFSVEASQLVWKNGMVKNSIKAQSLTEELMQLNYENDEQTIKLLVLDSYLNLYQLENQKKVYQQNIQLAQQRLDNINRFYKEGMVTRNDQLRGELQISNLNLALEVIENNMKIINKQLTTALGLSENTKIVPDENLIENMPGILSYNDYLNYKQNHPAIRMAHKAVDIYNTSEKIARAERAPSLSLFAGNQLVRPITTTSPVVDMYSHGWSAGVSLNFSIDALYKSPKKIKQVQLERDKALAQADETEQMIGVAVNAAYIKYNEALTQKNTMQTNRDLADENYRIMNSKYNNQLAILLDLIDASNAKLDAELQYANAEINIVNAYYKLLKESGNL